MPEKSYISMTYEDIQKFFQRNNTAIDAVGRPWTGRKQATFGMLFPPKCPRGLLNVVDRRPIGLINCMKEKSINCIKIKSNCIEAKKQKHKSHCINSIKAN
jgi:hypothetical protein